MYIILCLKGSNKATLNLNLNLNLIWIRQMYKSPQSPSSSSTHATMFSQKTMLWSQMEDWLTVVPDFSALPLLNKTLWHFDLEALRSRSLVWPKSKVTESTRYLINSLPVPFISTNQPEKHFLTYSYFEIWLQDQGHESGHKSRSHSSPSLQSMHFLFFSRTRDQTIAMIWPMKCMSLTKHIHDFEISNEILDLTR